MGGPHECVFDEESYQLQVEEGCGEDGDVVDHYVLILHYYIYLFNTNYYYHISMSIRV